METITYEVRDGLYLNITNRCPCSCTFCIRNQGAGVYGSDPLWLDHEPAKEEIFAALDQKDLTKYKEVVFCGYGEPAERLEILLETAEYIKRKENIRIRINTNGLADLINGTRTAPRLQGKIDAVSISLNAAEEETYMKIVRPRFGAGSFDAMLAFAGDCARYVPDVCMTVVDVVTAEKEQERCRRLCEKLGIKLRVRAYEAGSR